MVIHEKRGNKMVPNKKWFSQKWVDIGSKKKGGGFRECGRKSASGSKKENTPNASLLQKRQG